MDIDRFACRCSKESCHSIKFEWPSEPFEVLHVRSSRAGATFETVSSAIDDVASSSVEELDIKVDLTAQHQQIMGFGGAFTDAAGWHFANLSSAMSDKLIESYYGPDGLRYTYGRVPMAGSDFSVRAYSYDDTPNNDPDYALDHWSLQPEDLQLKIPFILKAKELVESLGTKLNLFATPWSPPAWMKTSNSFINGTLKDEPEVYTSYARYWQKFLDAYKAFGISFWGATIQNEPFSGPIIGFNFNNMQMGPEQTAKFVTQYLGPMLDEYYLGGDRLRLIVADDNLVTSYDKVLQMFNTPEMAKYISGMAFHWYQRSKVDSDKVLELYNQVKDKIEFLMMSEACEGSSRPHGVSFGNWSHAEAYANDIIKDFEGYTSSWIDWNLALNAEGGPNWVKNFVDSPIIVDLAKDIFYKQPMYYALGHFSRFILPGSVIVESSSSAPNEDFHFIASHNKQSQHLVVVILNKLEHSRIVNLVFPDGARLTRTLIAPRSISSIAIKL